MTKTITTLPQTKQATLCLNLTGVIDSETFLRDFESPLLRIIEKYGYYNLLVEYADGFEGWSAEAADLSFKCISAISPKARRCAYVNPPESRVMLMKIINPILTGEVQHFNADQREEALEWVFGKES